MSDAQDKQPAKPKRTRRAPSASGEGDGETPETPSEEAANEPQPCMPCHGTGKVISNLGGQSRKVTCPWCRGGGERLTGMDAQEFQQEQLASKRH